MIGGEDYFCESYSQARSLFNRMANTADVPLYCYEIPGKGPDGEVLATDIAWIGSPSAKRILVVQSGVHGVEAFAGAAIQCNLLDHSLSLRGDSALVLVHVVNPWGMAWLRRVNSSNVDLNRNCLPTDGEYSGAPSGYKALNGLINPASPPRKDLFRLKVAYQVVRRGRAGLKRAIAGGQYEFPDGLFYGGPCLQPEPAMLRRWLADHVKHVDQLVVVDLHTGLGQPGEHLVFPTISVDKAVRQTIEDRFGCVFEAADSGGDRYSVSGSMSTIYEKLYPDTDLQYFTVEFGTQSPIDVLRALRQENRHHFYSDGSLDHWSKIALKRALYPDSFGWRARVVSDGRRLVENALWYLDRDLAVGAGEARS
jgi:hypothetical protein